MSKFPDVANHLLDLIFADISPTTLTAPPGYTYQAGDWPFGRADGLSSGANPGYPYYGPINLLALPVRACLSTTLCDDTGPGAEFVGGGYSAKTLFGHFATDAALGVKNTTWDISWTNMPAGLWADVFIRDSSPTPVPLAYRGGTSLGKTVNSGDACLIPAGGFLGDGISGTQRYYLLADAMLDFLLANRSNLHVVGADTSLGDNPGAAVTGGQEWVIGEWGFFWPTMVHLTTAVCTPNSTGAEPSGGSYAPQSCAGAFGTAAAAKSKSNDGPISFSSLPAFTWQDTYISDFVNDGATPAHRFYAGQVALNVIVNSGDAILFAPGSIVATED